MKELDNRSKLEEFYYSVRRSVLNFPNNVKWWFLHRTFNRYNKIEIPSLKPGYYDKDIQMLHGMFDLLVRFVEVELAWMKLSLSEERKKVPWWQTKAQYVKKHGRELGLSYLDYWEHPENRSRANMNKSEGLMYTKRDREIKAIYLWYKDVRPCRYINIKDLDWYEKELADLKEDEEMLHRLVKIRTFLWT